VQEHVYGKNKIFFSPQQGKYFNHLRSGKSRKVFDSLNKKFELTKTRQYLDCGSAFGTEALQFTDVFNEIHCFEPVSYTYKFLEKSAQQHDNVFTYNVALSSYFGETELSINYANLQSSSLLKNRHDDKSEHTNIERVKVVPLDSYNFDRVDFIKIDVEGIEKDFLVGAKETLTNNYSLVRIEITENHEEVLDILRSYEYEPICFDVDGHEFEIKNDLFFKQFNGLVYWNSNQISIKPSFFISGKGFKSANENAIIVDKRQMQHFPVSPFGFNPCQGDFWFLKKR
jgi:FkbM family methyltransferase